MKKKSQYEPLREKCPYSESFWPVFVGIRIEYGPE